MNAKRGSLILAGVAAVFALIQLVPVDRTNPPVESTVPAPPEVLSILRRSCFDCHSNQTVWPWYSNLAPISFLLARDVNEGREELNFSTWQRYNAAAQRKKLTESWKEIEEGEMPPGLYLPMHSEARLSPQDKQILSQWIRGQTP